LGHLEKKTHQNLGSQSAPEPIDYIFEYLEIRCTHLLVGVQAFDGYHFYGPILERSDQHISQIHCDG
jgi:hypothetical protein